MFDIIYKKEIKVVMVVAGENDQDRNVGQDVIVQLVVQVLDTNNMKDETKGNETEHCNEEENKELVNKDLDDDYYVYKDEESRLLERKKGSQKTDANRMKEEERDFFGNYLI